ncbi:PREDICTED: coiled-coil domain-containing protein 1-like, partial [Acropora digitifera]|uniref:coiled-coil domain-containing protein 1-like n=1 Tax=Acropora digitifera TaxID=70779 RepID=UPI00077A67CA
NSSTRTPYLDDVVEKLERDELLKALELLDVDEDNVDDLATLELDELEEVLLETLDDTELDEVTVDGVETLELVDDEVELLGLGEDTVEKVVVVGVDKVELIELEEVLLDDEVLVVGVDTLELDELEEVLLETLDDTELDEVTVDGVETLELVDDEVELLGLGEDTVEKVVVVGVDKVEELEEVLLDTLVVRDVEDVVVVGVDTLFMGNPYLADVDDELDREVVLEVLDVDEVVRVEVNTLVELEVKFTVGFGNPLDLDNEDETVNCDLDEDTEDAEVTSDGGGT